jgi:hypothetical protein
LFGEVNRSPSLFRNIRGNESQKESAKRKEPGKDDNRITPILLGWLIALTIAGSGLLLQLWGWRASEDNRIRGWLILVLGVFVLGYGLFSWAFGLRFFPMWTYWRFL